MADFELEINRRVDEGKEQLIHNIKLLLFNDHPEWFDLLDFDNEKIFCEPLIYAYYNYAHNKLGIPQVLFGYVEPDKRPSVINVYSDNNGLIYLPNLGYLKTSVPNEILELNYLKSEDSIKIKQEDHEVPFTFSSLYCLGNTDIEITKHGNVSFSNFFYDGDTLIDPNVENTFSNHHRHLEKAFQILHDNCPFHYSIITSAIRKLVLYNNSVRRSFASMKANGAAFFNVKDHQDEVYLLEDITHQCGHIVYYYVLWNKEEYFKVSVDTPLRNFTDNMNDRRSVLGAFYSLLPFALSNLCSSRCYRAGVFSGEQAFEFKGRYAFRMQKFLMDIKNFSNNRIFTPRGMELYEIFREVAFKIYELDKDIIEGYDIANQDYEFNLALFKELNS